MKNIVIAISFAAVGAISTPSAARAQAAAFDSAQVTAVCAASSTQCQALVAQIIAQLKVADIVRRSHKYTAWCSRLVHCDCGPGNPRSCRCAC